MNKKIITIGIVFLLLAVSVLAASLNLARHSSRDFGTMEPKESKTMGYYIKGYYEKDDIYYSVCVEHSIEGEIKDWIKLKFDDSTNQVIYPNQKCNGRYNQWVGPELEVTWIKNAFVTIKVPRDALPGNYTATINNIACSPTPKKSGITAGICNSGPTEIKVTVI